MTDSQPISSHTSVNSYTVTERHWWATSGHLEAESSVLHTSSWTLSCWWYISSVQVLIKCFKARFRCFIASCKSWQNSGFTAWRAPLESTAVGVGAGCHTLMLLQASCYSNSSIAVCRKGVLTFRGSKCTRWSASPTHTWTQWSHNIQCNAGQCLSGCHSMQFCSPYLDCVHPYSPGTTWWLLSSMPWLCRWSDNAPKT